ncbi:hypothetical protein ACIP2X_01085 [Streptomyces sp. NPDC089424]|uniref:hypothetical protein n=1 Tax=Streptomyces sp. NPDC089424 TaxID=3365917 RepID=UPI00382570F9
MRRSARVLSVLLIAGAALGGAVPLAFADPEAEVSPAAAQPDGTVTVAVVCDALTGTPPEVIEATSEAFADGTVELKLVVDEEATATAAAGPVYEGSALLLPESTFTAGTAAAGAASAWTVDGTCPAVAGATAKAWSATFTVPPQAAVGGTPVCADAKQWCGGGPAIEYGVRAGNGGSFEDSVPALVAGGLLIAGAAGAAGHRLWRRDTRGDA